MLKATVLTWTTLLLVAGQATDPPTTSPALLGTWKITRFQTPNGPLDMPVGTTLKFEANGTLEYRRDDRATKASYWVKGTAEPCEVDMVPQSDASKRWPGIYKIERNTLTLCLDPYCKQRPTQFAAPADASWVLITLQKVR